MCERSREKSETESLDLRKASFGKGDQVSGMSLEMDQKSNGRQSHGKGKSRHNASGGRGNRTDKKPHDPFQKNGNDSHHSQRSTKQNNGQNQRQRQQQARNKPNALPYPPHETYEACMQRYVSPHAADKLVRGKLRVLPSTASNDAASFVTCDRGIYKVDICIPSFFERNRAMDGDIAFVELLPLEDQKTTTTPQEGRARVVEHHDDDSEDDETLWRKGPDDAELVTWQDDETQMDLWNPMVAIPRRTMAPRSVENRNTSESPQQRRGKVVHVVAPKAVTHSELTPSASLVPRRRIVGSLKRLPHGNVILFTPNNSSLPQFLCPDKLDVKLEDGMLYKAEYVFGSWECTQRWPPCQNVQVLGKSCILENEIQALLLEHDVDHGDFDREVLQNVENAVASGVFVTSTGELGWKPTPEMYAGRRDYRDARIFTIDPTTAKDLDDALHVTKLADGRVEIGVHIADVSYFVQPDSPVDTEAQYRATTVYLVDRTVPMLPRPLCEVACSLNENVERLAFSCVWTMNVDGTVRQKNGNPDVWYGRSVIKSCARLDYATAQNIIDGKVGRGESDKAIDEALWPESRRPTGGHTTAQVAQDVRLLHRVAMARRQLRFDNGALALNGIKLTFQLDTDGQTPLLAAPYPLRDSNRLVEEYMLMANYLVAERLITHTGRRAMLRRHPEPLEDGLDKVASVAKAGMGFNVDISSSQALHASLCRLGRECSDPLVLQCVTQMLMTPMQPADYFAAGTMDMAAWKHFALNIPYYTHFTSPIRRYADVIVHRLLQATIDGPEAVQTFPLDTDAVESIAAHCNEKRMASKKAQERCDRVFLSLFVKAKPMKSQLGIVLSVGVSTFTVFVPSLGIAVLLFLEEHKDTLTFTAGGDEFGGRHIVLEQQTQVQGQPIEPWGNVLEIRVFTKLRVTVFCKSKPPIDVKLRLEGPWTKDESRVTKSSST